MQITLRLFCPKITLSRTKKLVYKHSHKREEILKRTVPAAPQNNLETSC